MNAIFSVFITCSIYLASVTFKGTVYVHCTATRLAHHRGGATCTLVHDWRRGSYFWQKFNFGGASGVVLQWAWSLVYCTSGRHSWYVMETSGEALSTAAPTLHSLDDGGEQQKCTDSGEEGEKQPLLEGKGERKRLFVNLGRFSKWNWKNIITAIVFWFAYLAASVAYSIIGPFFPDEAAEKGSSSILTGIIISCSPLCVVILSPLIGYYVSD